MHCTADCTEINTHRDCHIWSRKAILVNVNLILAIIVKATCPESLFKEKKHGYPFFNRRNSMFRLNGFFFHFNFQVMEKYLHTMATCIYPREKKMFDTFGNPITKQQSVQYLQLLPLPLWQHHFHRGRVTRKAAGRLVHCARVLVVHAGDGGNAVAIITPVYKQTVVLIFVEVKSKLRLNVRTLKKMSLSAGINVWYQCYCWQ